MLHQLSEIILGQIQQLPTPPQLTGNPLLDTMITTVTGLLGLQQSMSLWDRFKKRDKTHAIHTDVKQTLEVQGATVDAIKDVARTLDQMQSELQNVRVQLAEIRGRMQ